MLAIRLLVLVESVIGIAFVMGLLDYYGQQIMFTSLGLRQQRYQAGWMWPLLVGFLCLMYAALNISYQYQFEYGFNEYQNQLQTANHTIL